MLVNRPSPRGKTALATTVACLALMGAGTAALFTTSSVAYATPVTPMLSIFAGTLGSEGPSSNGAATATTLYYPGGLTFDAQGNLLIGEIGTGQIAEVDSTGTLANLTTACEPYGLASVDAQHFLVADDCTYGISELSQSGMSWSSSTMNGTSSVEEPTAVALDAQGNTFMDVGWGAVPNEIFKVTPSGSLTVVAGDGSAGATTPGTATGTHLQEPAALATDAQGDVYIADSTNDTVDEVTPGGTLSIVAGNVSGLTAATNYTLSSPDGVAVDSAGNVFISDSGHGDVVRVTPSGAISVVVGTGAPGTPTPGPAAASPLDNPGNLAIDQSGNLYIADADWTSTSVIEKVSDMAAPPIPTLDTPTIPGQSLYCSWSAVGGATSYTLTVYVNGVAQTPVAGITATNYTFSPTTPGDSYTFTVAAVGNGGTSDPSAPSTSVLGPSAPSPSPTPALPTTAPPTTTPPTTTTPPAPEPVAPPVPTGGGVAATPLGGGYWALTPAGQLSDHGNAVNFGSENTAKLAAPVVAVSSTSTGAGYWLLGSDGGVFNFGTARFYGSLGARHMGQKIVGIAHTPDNGGYWLAGANGSVSAFGDAHLYGSMAGRRLNQAIVGIVATPDGHGYWLAGSDGGVFNFGDAGFYGSMGHKDINQRVVGIAATPDGHGYWLVAADGGVFNFGTARFYGSLGATGTVAIVGIVANADLGYRLITRQGSADNFGTVPQLVG